MLVKWDVPDVWKQNGIITSYDVTYTRLDGPHTHPDNNSPDGVKVASKDAKTSTCHFHTSNGNLIPEGFDRARDILEAGVSTGIIERSRAGVA